MITNIQLTPSYMYSEYHDALQWRYEALGMLKLLYDQGHDFSKENIVFDVESSDDLYNVFKLCLKRIFRDFKQVETGSYGDYGSEIYLYIIPFPELKRLEKLMTISEYEQYALEVENAFKVPSGGYTDHGFSLSIGDGQIHFKFDHEEMGACFASLKKIIKVKNDIKNMGMERQLRVLHNMKIIKKFYDDTGIVVQTSLSNPIEKVEQALSEALHLNKSLQEVV